jgi:hypothetical protein
MSRGYDWRGEYERQFGPLPGCMAGPSVANEHEKSPREERPGTAREAPGTRGGRDPVEPLVRAAGSDVGAEPASPRAERSGAGRRRSYIRSTDGALMVEVTPGSFVNGALL